MTKKQLILVYDRECPVCHRYCQKARIQDSVGELRLVNAREPSPILDEITAAGYDVDQGIVLKMDDAFYYGSDAMNMLALLSTRLGFFNRFNYWLFRSPRRAKILYPVLRLGRNLLLKFLRKTKINNLNKKNNTRF